MIILSIYLKTVMYQESLNEFAIQKRIFLLEIFMDIFDILLDFFLL